MIADVLIHVPAGESPDPGVDFGLSVARLFGAHATGIAFALEPQVTPAYFGAVPAEIFDDTRREAEKLAGAAAKRFTEAAQGMSLQFDVRSATTTIDGAADAFARLARLHDVTVLTQPNPDVGGPEGTLLEAALFDSGRSLLIVPYIQKAPLKLDRVLVAWDGGRAATRAVSEARPFLEKAKQVEVLVVESEKSDSDAMPGADLAHHLARHKLKVELRRTVAAGQNVDATILNEISDSNVDLVVMGGYGHSRLREFILGGVTRGMLQSMTAPVLMAH